MNSLTPIRATGHRVIDPEDLETLEKYPSEATALLSYPLDEIARTHGISVVVRFIAEYGGTKIYLPKQPGTYIKNPFATECEWLLTREEKVRICDELRRRHGSGDGWPQTFHRLRQFCRRKQVIEHLDRGLTTKQVAYIFNIPQRTVWHLKRQERKRLERCSGPLNPQPVEDTRP